MMIDRIENAWCARHPAASQGHRYSAYQIDDRVPATGRSVRRCNGTPNSGTSRWQKISWDLLNERLIAKPYGAWIKRRRQHGKTPSDRDARCSNHATSCRRRSADNWLRILPITAWQTTRDAPAPSSRCPPPLQKSTPFGTRLFRPARSPR